MTTFMMLTSMSLYIWHLLAIVLALTTALCLASGLAAIRKAFRADPAELF